MAHELRAEGLTVTPEEDYLSVAINLPHITINVIPDGPGLFELHIVESVGRPHTNMTDKHIGPMPDAFVIGAVMGIKYQLEAYSVALSAITNDPRKAAEMGMRAAGNADRSNVESKKSKAWHIIRDAGPEGIPADQLRRMLGVTLPRMRLIVRHLGERFVIEPKDGVLMVRYKGGPK